MKHKRILFMRAVTLSLLLTGLSAFFVCKPASALTGYECPDGTTVFLPANSKNKEKNAACANNQDQSKSGNGSQSTPNQLSFGEPTTQHQCGSGDNAVKTTINFGCKGESCLTSHKDVAYCSGDNSAIIDVLFAIIRFLSYGVGLIVVASVIIAGIQYSTSLGDPKATAAAETRMKSTVIALLIYIFAAAILDYVLPKGFLK